MSIAASKLQQRRRDKERLLHETESFLDQQRNTQRLHDWENRTNKKIEQREVSNLTKKLLKKDEDQLHEHQKELQSLFDKEMSQWKDTLETSMHVTQEERMKQIRQGAYALKAKREAERQAFVKECYRMKWKDECDDLRGVYSKSTMDRLTHDRQFMMQNKAASHLEERNSPKGQANQTLAFMEKRENDERELRRQTNLDTKKALDLQLEWKRSQIAAETAKVRQEEQDQLRRLAMLDQRARELEKEALQKAKEEGEEMRKETMRRAKDCEANRQLEKNRDSILLHHALDLERKQIEAEHAKREEGKDVATEYVHCLREQAERDEKARERVNAIRDGEFERIARQKEEKAMAETNMRQRWMEEVNLSRQDQIKRKQWEADQERRAKQQEFEQTMLTLRMQQEEEQMNMDRAKAERLETMMSNKAMIERRAKEREMEKQEQYLLNKQFQYAERMLQKKMKEQIDACHI